MDFSKALKHLKNGKRVARKGWNGKNMFLFLAEPLAFSASKEATKALGYNLKGNGADILPSMAMFTADKKISIGWLANQTDMLAEDWGIIESRKVKK